MKKNLFALGLLLVACLASSCSEKAEVAPGIFPEDGLITLTRTIDAVVTRSGESAVLTAVFDLNDESLVEYSVSPEFLEAVGMTAEELDLYLKDEMGSLYYMQSGPLTRGPHSDCINNCNDTLERGGGRGACRFNCWVDTVERYLTQIATIVSSLS